MKTSQALQKNLKLLFRSKETAFTIIFGPLLIILLVGFAFSGSQGVDINVGVYAPEYTDLTDEFVRQLQDDYTVNILSSNEECVGQVEEGLGHLCITFPQDFTVRAEHTNLVEFHVDPSRINLVYQVIDRLGEEFEAGSDEISMGLTSTILQNLNVTQTIIDEQVQNTEAIQGLRADAAGALTQTQGRLAPDDLNFSISLSGIRGRVTTNEQATQQLYDIAIVELDRAIQELESLESECDDCSNETQENIENATREFENAQEELTILYEESPERLQEIYGLIDEATSEIATLKEDYQTIQEDAGVVRARIASATGSLDEMRDRLSTLRGSLNYASDLISGTEVADSESVVNPIRTSVNEVTGEDTNIAYTYPYILLLVIMFMGLMLGSTLIVSDKNSKAAFRNFTTATRDSFHIIMSFITTLLVLLAQVLVILLFSYFLVAAPLFSNFLTSFTIILLAIILFSFLGMILGYLSRSQEAAMIASLTIGSIMLFVSNLVIPTEAMQSFVRIIAGVNPYVILSELLRQSMLFQTPLSSFTTQIIMLILFALVLLGVILGVQQYVRRRYFRQQATLEPPKKKTAKPLQLGEKTIKDEFDLLTVLDLMTREEFKKHVSENENKIASWARKELDNTKLARKLSTTNKERMIIKLDKHLKKMTKKRKKK